MILRGFGSTSSNKSNPSRDGGNNTCRKCLSKLAIAGIAPYRAPARVGDMSEFRYAAFISYSSMDAAFARRLHRALEHYAIPGALGSFTFSSANKPNRLYPIFRDREELPAGDLSEAITDALQSAGALIVVCSPNAAKSKWVNKEIEHFLATGRRDRIFAIIADDAPLQAARGDSAQAC
ncbi:MAG TPA: toll/interleukin-1 receptor domain-containing protein, partial [Terricaulis sp.]|nr:toll/interleukin-1 receptor domain-containing protein [Terricaulis sp.]